VEDLIAAIDARIAAYRDRRASVVRFSADFWDADDALMWWRGVRDELKRSGRIGPEIEAVIAEFGEPGIRPRPLAAAIETPAGQVAAELTVVPAGVDATPTEAAVA